MLLLVVRFAFKLAYIFFSHFLVKEWTIMQTYQILQVPWKRKNWKQASVISVLGNLLEVIASEYYIGGTVQAQMCYCKKSVSLLGETLFMVKTLWQNQYDNTWQLDVISSKVIAMNQLCELW